MTNDQMESARPLPDASAPRLHAHLAGIALKSAGPERAVRFYCDALGYAGQWTDAGWTGFLGARGLTISRGATKAVDHVAYALHDAEGVAQLKERLSAAAVNFEAVYDSPLIGDGIRFRDPDGNMLLLGVARSDIGATSPDEARLQHAVFASDNTPAMVRFYCDVVGFAPSDYVKDNDGDLTSAFLRCSAEHHSLAIFRAPEKRLDHLCYDIESWMQMRDWGDRFATHDIPLRWGPGRHGPGNNLFLFVSDPDGNWLEFSAELEQVEGTRPVKLWAHEQRTLNSWGTAFMRS